MTPDEMAEVRPRLVAFAAEMLGGLARKDQRAAGELYVRAAGRRAAQAGAADGCAAGAGHQRLQQFITSSTWEYVAVRRNVARHFAASQPVEALVAGDTGLPKDGHQRQPHRSPTASASATSKDAPTWAGTATSLSPPSPRPSAP
jgi:SRSO17 transposase